MTVPKILEVQDEERGWAVGEERVILHTEDGGETWINYPCSTTGPYYLKISNFKARHLTVSEPACVADYLKISNFKARLFFTSLHN